MIVDFRTEVEKMRKLLALLSLVCAVSVEAAPTLISRWDFDNYNPANIVDALKPSAGTSSASIGICNGSGASTAALAGIIGPAYLVDGSVAPGLAAGDYAIALPKGTHLKVPFPGGVIKNKHWTVRVRFFHPAASGGKPRAILQPALNNKGQYFFGLDAGNRLFTEFLNLVSLDGLLVKIQPVNLTNLTNLGTAHHTHSETAATASAATEYGHYRCGVLSVIDGICGVTNCYCAGNTLSVCADGCGLAAVIIEINLFRHFTHVKCGYFTIASKCGKVTAHSAEIRHFTHIG